MIRAKSTVKLNMSRIKQLNRAAVTALEKTAEALHTEVVQAQVMPFDDPHEIKRKVYGKRGQFAKNGREYKGKIVRETVHGGGTLQNASTFVDNSSSQHGEATLVSSTPYARRLYYHPEYHFDTGENPNAKGKWYEDWLPEGKEADFAPKAFKKFYKQDGEV